LIIVSTCLRRDGRTENTQKEGIMKKFLLVLFVVLITAGSAYAEGTTVDFGPALGTEPVDGFGTTVGGVVGASVDFGKIIHKEFNQRDRLRFRGDISYFKWTDEEFGVDIEYRRIPVFLGVRYVYPVNPTFSVFGEGGAEISFDKVEVAVCVFNNCESDSEEDTNTGLSVGGGVIFNFSPKFRISLSGRQHTLTDEYTSFAGLFGISF
jgi:opacity protein-like surface antigen